MSSLFLLVDVIPVLEVPQIGRDRRKFFHW
jgi:hypothetical protein